MTISEHEGRKYLRPIQGWVKDPVSGAYKEFGQIVYIDIYAVLAAYRVTCQATGHAAKKLLAAGERGKGSRLEDLKGAAAAISRAIELEEQSIYEAK